MKLRSCLDYIAEQWESHCKRLIIFGSPPELAIDFDSETGQMQSYFRLFLINPSRDIVVSVA